MTIQFAGSSSTGDRRRRRLAVNGDGSDVDSSLLDGDAGTIESQLVASAAAAPWVPVSERRIWIYASIIGLILAGLTFVLARPIPFRPALTPLADHLLAGSRPVLVVVVQTAFLVLSTQLGMLISWYRSQCKLDFAGRYRVWPWAVGLFSLGTFCEATDIHQIFGHLIARRDLFIWRGETVSWLLPLCVAALPIAILVDRDVRNNRSSLITLRLSGLLWLTAACLEIYQSEFSSFAWFGLVRQVVPIYASSTLFLGLWLQARIVAYVCPDPPEIEERSAGAVIFAAAVWLVGRLKFPKRAQALATSDEEEEEAKPKRRRKKAEEPTDIDEPTTVKRKRKAPAKKPTTTRTRSRIKPVELEETEESEEFTEETGYEESESTNEYAEDSSAESLEETSSVDEPVEDQEPQAEEQYEQESWEEEPVEPVNSRASASKSKGNGRFTQIDQPQKFKVPAPHVSQPEPVAQRASEEQASNPYETSNDESDEDRQFQLDSGMSPDQMKGLSKRQKRELKKQLRDQQRFNARD